MQTPDDVLKLILQSNDLLEETRRILAAGKQQTVRHELLASIPARMNDAQNKPGLPAEEITPDAATVFARRIRRRRTIV
jgi:hypothetical protein